MTLVLAGDLDIGRGDVLAVGAPYVASRFEAHVVWMDERPLDTSRVYLLKQTGRTVTAEIDRPLALNEIGAVGVATGKPIVFDGYATHHGTGSFIVIDPATSFTAGAGMIVQPARQLAGTTDRLNAAQRLAHVARSAANDTDAITAVRQALEEILT